MENSRGAEVRRSRGEHPLHAMLCALLMILCVFGCKKEPAPEVTETLPASCCHYIDKTGKTVIKPDYGMTTGFDFQEGLSGVKNHKGDLGYIDKQGKLVIPFQFQDGTSHSEGVAGVLKGNMCGFIDKTGKLIIPLKYDSVTNFNNGWGIGKREGKYFFVNAKGEEMPPAFVAVESFSEGLAAVAPIAVEADGSGDSPKHGFIDPTGKIVIQPEYEEAEPFSEGLAAVMRNKKWGYLDKTGKIVIEPQFDLAGPFKEGYGQVTIGTKMGYIDTDGQIVIEPRFEADQYQSDPDEKHILIGQFVNGLAAVRHSVGPEAEMGWGFIDKSGKFQIPPVYEDAYMFTEGLARVKQNGKWGFIDPKGKMVIPATYPMANSFAEGLALVGDY